MAVLHFLDIKRRGKWSREWFARKGDRQDRIENLIINGEIVYLDGTHTRTRKGCTFELCEATVVPGEVEYQQSLKSDLAHLLNEWTDPNDGATAGRCIAVG